MRDEIPGDGVEPLGRGDDVVVPPEFTLEPLFDIDVAGLEFLQLLGDPLVELVRGNAELLAPRVVEERYRRAVLHRPLEPVSGDVVAEHLPGDLIILHQWSAREGDIEGVRERVALVEGQAAVLRPVRFVDDDDDVVPVRVRLVRQDILVEFLNEREDT